LALESRTKRGGEGIGLLVTLVRLSLGLRCRLISIACISACIPSGMERSKG
jgi:hypothetical protein